MVSIHAANTEVNTDQFDYFTEWQQLRRLTRQDAIAVGVVIGPDLHYVSHVGPGIVKNFIAHDENNPDASSAFSGQVVVQYRKGKLVGANGQKGQAREYRCEPKFYHRDRVAEMLRRDMEAA